MVKKAEQSPPVWALRIFISFNVCFITTHRAGSAWAASERQRRILLALFWSQLLLTASTVIQCQSTVPHFHIPISFVSWGQTGTGALLCQILEGGHRCILLTTAITAKGKAASQQSDSMRHCSAPFNGQGTDGCVKAKYGWLFQDDSASI